MQVIKLDLKDKKILFELDFHARDANAKIAKKVRLSKQGVDYKIRNLVERGVIQSFAPIINGNQLGYFYGRLFIKFQNLTQEKENKIFNELIANPLYKWVTKSEGPYDTIFATWTKTLKEFKGISEELIGKYGFYIKEKRESVGVRLTHFQSRYLLGTQDTEEVAFEETTKPTEIDETDKKILRILTKDARLPLVKIAQATNTSAKVISYRLKRLQEEKVILGYRPIVNNELIGFKHYKVFFYLTNVTEEKLTQFKSYLKSLSPIMYIVEEIGITDVDIELMLPTGESVFEFVDKICFTFPELIRDYEAFAIKTLKLELLPF